MPVTPRPTVPVKLFDAVTVTTYVTVLPAVTDCCAGETLIENVPGAVPVVLAAPPAHPFETARSTQSLKTQTRNTNAYCHLLLRFSRVEVAPTAQTSGVPLRQSY